MRTFNLVIDEAIPFIDPLFRRLCHVTALPDDQINSQNVRDADALIIRSVTPINQALLADSKVRFVGTATIGMDHIDQQWLLQQNISVHNAPGCNAAAVAQYVLSAISHWCFLKQSRFNQLTVGVVGVGQVGARLVNGLMKLGLEVNYCDPFRNVSSSMSKAQNMSLSELMRCSDVISFHVPFSSSGDHPSYHLLSQSFLKSQELDKNCQTKLLINTSRGNVFEEGACRQWLNLNRDLVLDVWPNEPQLNYDWIRKVILATPHIAGYSLEGKLRASFQIYQRLCEFLEQSSSIAFDDLIPDKSSLNYTKCAQLEDCLLQSFDIAQVSSKFWEEKQYSSAADFKAARNNYVLRREYAFQDWEGEHPFHCSKRILDQLSHELSW